MQTQKIKTNIFVNEVINHWYQKIGHESIFCVHIKKVEKQHVHFLGLTLFLLTWWYPGKILLTLVLWAAIKISSVEYYLVKTYRSPKTVIYYFYLNPLKIFTICRNVNPFLYSFNVVLSCTHIIILHFSDYRTTAPYLTAESSRDMI